MMALEQRHHCRSLALVTKSMGDADVVSRMGAASGQGYDVVEVQIALRDSSPAEIAAHSIALHDEGEICRPHQSAALPCPSLAFGLSMNQQRPLWIGLYPLQLAKSVLSSVSQVVGVLDRLGVKRMRQGPAPCGCRHLRYVIPIVGLSLASFRLAVFRIVVGLRRPAAALAAIAKTIGVCSIAPEVRRWLHLSATGASLHRWDLDLRARGALLRSASFLFTPAGSTVNPKTVRARAVAIELVRGLVNVARTASFHSNIIARKGETRGHS